MAGLGLGDGKVIFLMSELLSKHPATGNTLELHQFAPEVVCVSHGNEENLVLITNGRS